jgi:Zn-finger protein
MRKIDIVNNYFANLVEEFNIYGYCPSYFELKDWDNINECGEESLHCKECWCQEAEENKDNILKALWKLNNINRSKIKELYKKEKELLNKIQELCP